jgi:hypothetical protein
MCKHAVADFYLQSAYQYLNKGTYGHPGGIEHSAIHAALTPLVYLVIAPASLMLALIIAISEFLLHYHIDWLKEQVTHRNGWTAKELHMRTATAARTISTGWGMGYLVRASVLPSQWGGGGFFLKKAMRSR